ncbi:aromatic amino acid lyase [Corynebacterium ureicelerivorans]|uniref:Uncharacterized protein n=1 Tax=Corynebacterium ureicelerivorans TaxID=401472 RepID=A0A077HJU5_9CORY|nr:aromatic amino acid lyase [Corynebacterium ureicelerivorans]AIL96590.1 hypothetical protein CUREI_04145 [Corynebacterium ureicelerivorans]
MAFTLSELRNAVQQIEEPQAWSNRVNPLADERYRIEQFIESGGQAYGFTTLFGHLDSIKREREAISSLYQGHLVGHPDRLDPVIARGIVAVKLCQLSNGGTGISLASYERLREAYAAGLDDVRVDLYASYGSGDVVPGAWLVNSIFGGVENLRRGDLMALINGAYLPAGVLLGALDQLETVVSRGLVLIADARDVSKKLQKSSDVQLPVSLRDLTPLHEVVDHARDQIEAALLRAANRRSGNPMFQIEGGVVQPWSNSSFLDFQLTFALSTAHEASLVIAAYATSATRWVCGSAELLADELQRPLFVQLPKVAKAYEDKLLARSAGASYSQNESRGVEDISDSSLRRVLDLVDSASVIDNINDLLEEALRMV